MNGIQGTKPAGRQWNRLLYVVVTILRYKKITIDNAIYIKVFSDGTLSYITFSTGDVINTYNIETAFTELRICFEEAFEIKVQEESILKYPNVRIFQYNLGFSVDHTDNIMELVNEWLPTGKFRKVDTTFMTNYTYKKELMTALTLTGNALHKLGMDYNGKSGQTLGWKQHIDIMGRIEICYKAYLLETQTLAPTIPGFQGIKRCIQYLDIFPHNPYFILIINIMDKIS